MRVLVNSPLTERFREEMEKAAEPETVTWIYGSRGPSDAWQRHLSQAQIYVGAHLTPDECHRAERLRFFQLAGAGLDGVPLDQLDERVTVANVFLHERSIAEYILMAMIASQRRILRSDQLLRSGQWESAAFDQQIALAGTLRGRTVGMLGYGHIARELTSMCKFFEMRVEAVRLNPIKFAHDGEHVDWGGGPNQVQELLTRADFVVVMTPLTDATRSLIGEPELALMKPTSYIINVARGPVIDQWALYNALTSGQIAGAALDVWYTYPTKGNVAAPSDAPLWGLPNVIVTPHIAGVTDDVVRERAIAIGANVGRFIRGEAVQNLVPRE